MMTNDISIGTNHTGIELSPIDKRELVEAAERSTPSMQGDESSIAELRNEYVQKGDKIGSMPPPASLKGAASMALDALKGTRASIFLDKLGERLAFERTGTRLYDALISKFEGSEVLGGGPSLEELQQHRNQEHAHFILVRDAIAKLGGDPTTLTPSADVTAVTSLGLVQILSDPRTTLKQALEAILVAELVDQDGWMMLVELAREAGHQKLAEQFEQALDEEDEHLQRVRTWVMATTMAMINPTHAIA